MKINTKTFQYLKNQDSRLCNDFIFDGIISKLEQIDFLKINELKSKWCIESEQSKINKGYIITLEAKNDSCIPITFYLWDSEENSYIGKLGYHIADDATVRNDKENCEFSRHLFYLFNCDIKETIFYKKDRVVGYEYEFMNKSIVVHKIKHNKLLKIFYNNKVVNKYNAWIG